MSNVFFLYSIVNGLTPIFMTKNYSDMYMGEKVMPQLIQFASLKTMLCYSIVFTSE